MAKRDKRLEALRRNARHVRFTDACLVLEDNGFTARQPSGGSSHWTFSHPQLPNSVVLVERRPFVLPVYVRNLLDAIDKVED